MRCWTHSSHLRLNRKSREPTFTRVTILFRTGIGRVRILRETGWESNGEIMRLLSACRLAAASSLALASASFAASFANQVVSYTPGNGVGVYTNPNVALGAPDGITGENNNAQPAFGGAVLSPFNAAYQNDEIVRVGEGGSITLRLERFVNVGPGAEFGVIENVLFFDPAYPSGTTSDPAAVFGNDNALVEVSQDGINFVGLSGAAATNVNFNIPALYYLNAGAFDETAPVNPQLADFGKPFTGDLSSFNGKGSYAEVVSVFNGSAGGTWLDASSSGLTSIGYVRFSVPDDNDPSTTNNLELDSVLTNSALLGGIVPEPTSLVSLLGLVALRRSRR